MPAEATTKHEAPGRTPDQPSGDSALGLQAGIHGEQTRHPNAPQGAAATVEVVNLRFDRIEDRLISLERMLSELISTRCEPKSVGVPPAVERQPEVTPVPSQADGLVRGQAQASELPAWEERSDDEELDVSVRDYIERLLQRDNAGPLDHPSEASRVPRIEPPVAPIPQDADAESPPTALESSLPEEQHISDPPAADRLEESPDATPGPASLPPRHSRPERDANLDAMRVVANLSAKAAIRTYEKSQAARKTVDRLPLLLIGLICALMLLYTAFSSGEKAMLVGAGVAFLGAALTAWQLMIIVLRWLLASRPVPDP